MDPANNNQDNQPDPPIFSGSPATPTTLPPAPQATPEVPAAAPANYSPFNQNPAPTTQQTQVSEPVTSSAATVVTSSGGGGKKVIIVGLVGVLLLVGGIAAAMFFRGQQATPTNIVTEEVPEITISSPAPTAVPAVAPIASCKDIKVFDEDWEQILAEDLPDLIPGDTIRFTASATAISGEFTKARFTINGVLRPEVTTKRPLFDDFYDEYTIPEDITSFSVEAQVYHDSELWI